MAKQSKIDVLQKELVKAYIKKDYTKANEIQSQIDYFNYGIPNTKKKQKLLL